MHEITTTSEEIQITRKRPTAAEHNTLAGKFEGTKSLNGKSIIKNIQQIRDASIYEVISHYVTVKPSSNGSGYACCPFHNERTPSFHVHDAKGIYKCFGCGAGGDAIRFVMEYEKKTFIEAVQTIASITGIQLEVEEREQTEKEKESISAAEAQEAVLNYVVPLYRKALFALSEDHPVKVFLRKRGITDEVAAEWQLGWAGIEWKSVTSELIEKGFYEAANKLGIIKRSATGDNSYDGYRSRITIPICDRNGRYIGMGGRFIEIEKTETTQAKYINPADCELYNKSTVLFGINKAAKTIQSARCAVVVEGYFDVISPHHIGIENVVGTCGTAVTDQQLTMLKKHTTHLVGMFDNDDAGTKAFEKLLPVAIAKGFKVSKAVYEGKDPDEWSGAQPAGAKSPATIDGILWYADTMMAAAEDLHSKASAKEDVMKLVSTIPNELIKSNYLDDLMQRLKWNRTDTKKQFKDVTKKGDGAAKGNADGPIKLPGWITEEQEEAFIEKGYVPIMRKDAKGKTLTGYFSFNQGGKVEITNFVCTPLFHVYAGVESRYLLQIYNGYREAVLDVPAKALPSIDQFQAFTVSEGNYLIFGAKAQWLRIASDLLQQFPRCVELKNLGWQTFDFFAWVDKIYLPGEGLRELDRWGIIKIEDQNYLIPASCEAYKQLQHTGEDPYENDRHLAYKKSPVLFSQWAAQMQRVYEQKGTVGVACVIMALFRDLVFGIDNNCPHLYAYGEPTSGKSKWAESINAVFFYKRSAFNLNSGTDFAFFSYMQKYNNAPAQLNEFDIEVIKPEWFQAIKGVYDGEGRERGKGGSKNRTEIMKVRSLLVLAGQKLITADDNSVVTRSLIESFSIRERTEADEKAYDQLKEWQHAGLSGMLVELLKLRPLFELEYKDHFNQQLSQWRRGNDARACNQRILQNYAHLSTGYALAAKHIQLPQSAEDFTDYCLERAIHWSLFIRRSDTLSEFWQTFEFLVNQQQVVDGWDYDIRTEVSVPIREGKKDIEKPLDGSTKVLFLRLNNVHKLFQSTYRLRSGKEAMNLQNLLHYFSSRKYYLGPVKQRRFKRFVAVTDQKSNGLEGGGQYIHTEKKLQETITSCYAFLYEELGVEIERMDGTE